jgi:hypothetical protein
MSLLYLLRFRLSFKYGGLINFISPSLAQIDIREGFYSEIQISLFDQNNNNLQFRDFEITLVLLIDGRIMNLLK